MIFHRILDFSSKFICTLAMSFTHHQMISLELKCSNGLLLLFDIIFHFTANILQPSSVHIFYPWFFSDVLVLYVSTLVIEVLVVVWALLKIPLSDASIQDKSDNHRGMNDTGDMQNSNAGLRKRNKVIIQVRTCPNLYFLYIIDTIWRSILTLNFLSLQEQR